MAVTPDGLRCQSREQREWHGCRANKGVQGEGKFFYEATVTDEGLCRVGWSMSQVQNWFSIHDELQAKFWWCHHLCLVINDIRLCPFTGESRPGNRQIWVWIWWYRKKI